MTPEQAAQVLAVAALAGLVQHPPDSGTAAATARVWAAQLDEGMIPEQAIAAVNWLGADPQRHGLWITAGHVNGAARRLRSESRDRERAAIAAEGVDAHCGRAGCPCTHTGGCYRGWIDNPDTATTASCRQCRPIQAQAVAELPPPGRRRPGQAHERLAEVRKRDGWGQAS